MFGSLVFIRQRHRVPPATSGRRKSTGSWCAFSRISPVTSSAGRLMPLACARPSISMPKQRAWGRRHCSVDSVARPRVDPRDVLDVELVDCIRRSESGIAAAPGTTRRSAMSRAENSASSRPRSPMFPVDPADLVVLAIGVVVAVLRAAELVAGKQHRRALRQQQRREEIALLALAQRDDLGIVGRAFGAAVPATGCRRGRRGCPRRSPRCACRCRRRGRCSVKPSCAVMKLTLAQGLRPRRSNRSPEAVTRAANSAQRCRRRPSSSARTVSRNLSFHSAQPGGKPPT